MATETISLVLDETWALVSNAAAGSFGGFVVSGPVIWSLGSTQPAASRNYGITDKRLIYPSLDTKVYARSASGPALITVSRTVDGGNAAESTAMPNGGGSVSVTTFRNDVAMGSTVATIAPSVTGAKATGIYPTNSGLRIGANGLDLIKTETPIPAGALNLTIIMEGAKSLNSPTSFNVSFDVTAPPVIIVPPTPVFQTLSLSARSVAQNAAPGTLIGNVSNMLSGSALSLVTGSPFVAVSGSALNKGSRTYRPAYHNAVVRETNGAQTNDTTLTLKAGRSSVVMEDFEDVTTGWVHTDATKVTADKTWFMTGAQSMNLAQPSGAANQTLTATKTLASGEVWGLDEVYSLTFNNKGTADPGNVAVSFISSGNYTLVMNINNVQSVRKGIQTVCFRGRDMTTTGTPSDFTGSIAKVVVRATGAAGMSVSFDSFRRGAKGAARLKIGADDGYDDFWSFLWPAMTSRFGAAVTPYLALQTNIIDSSNSQVPRLTTAHLQACAAGGCNIINHSRTHPDFSTLSRADQVAQFQTCADYIHGVGGKRISGDSGYNATTDVATGVDISTKALPSGRRCKSSAYSAVMPGYGFNTDTIGAARDVGMQSFVGTPTGGGYGAKDGMGSYWNLPRFSGNLSAPDAAYTWIDSLIATGQDGDLFFHDFGRVDAGFEGVKTAIGTTKPVANAILDYVKTKVDAGLLEVITHCEMMESLPQAPLPAAGVNLAGGEFGGRGNGDYHVYSATLDLTDPMNLRGPSPNYAYPTAAEVNYYADRGVTIIRCPIRYHHLFQVVSDTDPTQDVARTSDWTKFNAFLDACANRGVEVIVDMHEYGYQTVDGDPGNAASYHTSAVFYQNNATDKNKLAKRWVNIASRVKTRLKIRYGIMNEPTNKPNAPGVTDLFVILQAAMTAIAAEDTNPAHVFHICGWGYSSAAGWVSSGNAAAFLTLSDPRGGKPIAEVHQYLDVDPNSPGSESHPGKEANPVIVDLADSPGSYTYNGTTYTFAPVLKAATEHARANGYFLFMGEYAYTQDGVYSNEGRREARYMHDNRDGWNGHTLWGPGPFWQALNADGSIRKPFSPEPRDLTSTLHIPQMNVLSEFLNIGA